MRDSAVTMLIACTNWKRVGTDLLCCKCTQCIQVSTLEVTMRHGAVLAACCHDTAVHCMCCTSLPGCLLVAGFFLLCLCVCLCLRVCANV